MTSPRRSRSFHSRAQALLSAFSLSLAASGTAFAAGTPLDSGLRTDDKESEEISNVFKEMGVVQKRAMPKGGRFLFSAYGSFDFSDGPYTNYSININPGYALSDFFEVYVNYVPMFITQARSINDQLASLTVYNAAGQRTTPYISAALPKSQIGAELLWAPAYGKDNLGLRTVLRSDTFFKLGVAQTTYDTDTGLRFVLGVGKTFFLGRYAGLRLCVNAGMVQNTIYNQKAFRNMALIETSFNFYL